ncbi:unnamed protein product [Dovyalis caffra]|uniref:Uncharacterized protein n=1 Tax=Dovyalis caffra TaxID=77055 RepID=A0AAV1SS28_9ROSI|nr:unnamed protein product [Dovyalis caffra]
MNYAAETSLGAVTIRAFKMADRFFQNYLKLVDNDAVLRAWGEALSCRLGLGPFHYKLFLGSSSLVFDKLDCLGISLKTGGSLRRVSIANGPVFSHELRKGGVSFHKL